MRIVAPQAIQASIECYFTFTYERGVLEFATSRAVGYFITTKTRRVASKRFDVT